MRRALLVLTLLLVSAPAARADDAAVFAVYDDQAQLDTIVGAQRAVVREKSGRARARGIIRTDRRMNRELARIGDALAGAEASTDDGRAAQDLGVRETRAWRKANRLEVRSIRAYYAGRARRYERLLARANRTMKRRTFPSGKKAVRRFKAVGLSSPRRALSQNTKG